jgi:copper(I)-binding protein
MTGSFMTITNNGDKDVTLVGGSSPIAGIVEIHEVINGSMQPMANGLVIPAGESVKLRMGGYHVMLLELDRALKAGEEVEVTLRFSDGTELTVTAPVKDIAMDDEIYGATGGM